jgi:YHS domain-containing protein
MMVIDPVCGMQFEEEMAVAALERNGEIFHFCSEACLQSFEEDPEGFAERMLEDAVESA